MEKEEQLNKLDKIQMIFCILVTIMFFASLFYKTKQKFHYYATKSSMVIVLLKYSPYCADLFKITVFTIVESACVRKNAEIMERTLLIILEIFAVVNVILVLLQFKTLKSQDQKVDEWSRRPHQSNPCKGSTR